MSHITHDPDHIRHIFAWTGHPDLFADGVFIGEKTPRQGLAQNHHALRLGMVPFSEDASRAQRNAHRPEVILAYDADGNGGLIEIQELRAPRKSQPSLELKVSERQVTDGAGGFNPGQRGNALQEFPIKSVAPTALLEPQ